MPDATELVFGVTHSIGIFVVCTRQDGTIQDIPFTEVIAHISSRNAHMVLVVNRSNEIRLSS